MYLSTYKKQAIKRQILEYITTEKNIKKAVIFGSFLTSKTPNDLDLAIIDSGDDDYLTLALKYRKNLRSISKILPIDILPISSKVNDNWFMSEIKKGEVIYEKRD